MNNQQQNPYGQQQNPYGYGNQQQPSSRKTLYLVGYVFNMIAAVILGIFIVPLLWCIPTVVASKRAYNECDTPQEISHIGLGIVSLLLVSGIGGILILIASAIKPEPVIIYNQGPGPEFPGSGVDPSNGTRTN